MTLALDIGVVNNKKKLFFEKHFEKGQQFSKNFSKKGTNFQKNFEKGNNFQKKI